MKINQNMYRDLLRHQELPGMTCDTRDFIKLNFKKSCSRKILEILTKSWRMFTICGVIQNLGWTQIDSTLKIIMVRIQNASF